MERGRRTGPQRRESLLRRKEITIKTDEDGDDETDTRLFARATPVFAAEQVDGYAAPALPEPLANPVEPIERAEAFIAATGAIVHHGGSRAFYRRSTDDIHLPPREAFRGTPTSTAAQAPRVDALERRGEPLQSPIRQAVRR